MPRVKLVDPATGEFIVPVVIDTREQLPFTFEGMTCDVIDGGKPLIVTTQRGTLRSGDYSLLGFESKVAIERKSLADAYSTLSQGRDRFERELVRLSAYQFAAVVIEADWPTICADPPPHTKLAPKTVFRSIVAWTVRFPSIHWIPAGPRRLAEVTTFRLLERFLKEEFQSGKQRGEEREQGGKEASRIDVSREAKANNRGGSGRTCRREEPAAGNA